MLSGQPGPTALLGPRCRLLAGVLKGSTCTTDPAEQWVLQMCVESQGIGLPSALQAGIMLSAGVDGDPLRLPITGSMSSWARPSTLSTVTPDA